MVQIARFVVPICLAVMLLFSVQLFGTQSMANAKLVSQDESINSLKVAVLKVSRVVIRIDGVLKFSGTLSPGFSSEWSGEKVYLEVQSGSAVQVTLNEKYLGVFGTSSLPSTLNWPPQSSAASSSEEPTSAVQAATAAPTAVPTATSTTVVAPTTAPTARPTDRPTAVATTAPLPTANPLAILSATSTPIPLPAATAPPAEAAVVAAVPALQEDYYYTVQPGDVLSVIAAKFDLTAQELAQANEINNPGLIRVGMRLKLPNYEPSSYDQALGVETGVAAANVAASPDTADVEASISPENAFSRLTLAAQAATSTSPYYYTTLVTYYGRPNVPIMGILGEYSIDQLTPILKDQAAAYDRANGPQIGVKPVYHLVYGMAARAPGRDGTYLVFLEDEVVQAYIDRAQVEGFDVILDVQIGALTPTDSLALAFKWLKYPNVHLGLDPEFAMSHPGQAVPGNPIGFVTAAQVNNAQRAMQDYLIANGLSGSRILLLHQFVDRMIVNKPDLDWSYPQVDLTVSVDGWGGPWNKISKYNSFVNAATKYSAFKLFYRWDEPILSEEVAMGSASYGDSGYYRMKTTPNLIIYQ